MSIPQLTTLLPNDLLARMERLRVNPRKRKTNRQHGEHLSGKGGTSIEFSDYRDYVAGDDLRYVDWNVFSRLNQPYLKLYAHEEEMQVPILLDASNSMNFEGKFELARQIAAAFGMAGLTSVEKVSCYSCSQRGKAPEILGPSEINPEYAGDFRFVDSESGGTLDISSVGELLGLYKSHRLALENHLLSECQKRDGRFLSLSSDRPIKSVVFDDLVRQGWLK